MNIIEWKESMSVGNVNLDAEHKQLISLINKLSNAMQQGHGKDIMKDVLNELANYTVCHFQHEENIFSSSGYPQTEAHKQKHDILIQKVKEIKDKFESGETTISISTLEFLKAWINEHIMKTDMTYAGYISNY